MANRWGIPKSVEEYVTARDTHCVYCGVEFIEGDKSRRTKASWEHIINNVEINGISNIALCCMSCNTSKGAKLLENWLESNYCRRKGITSKSVADVVKHALLNPPKFDQKTK